MVEVNTKGIKELISDIYECQKRIMINKRFLLEIRNNGGDSIKLQQENIKIENQINEYKKKLSSLRNLN